MRVDSLTVEGFGSIREATVRLGDINVLVGANGAGKSWLVRALELSGRLADGDLAYFTKREGGASALLYRPDARQITLQLEGEPTGYRVTLAQTADDQLVISEEDVITTQPPFDQPLAQAIDRDDRESALPDRPARTAVPDAGKVSPEFQRLAARLLHGWRVFHFHDTSLTAPVKQPQPTADNLALRSDAGNLAAVLAALRDSQPEAYGQIVRSVRQVAPFFRDFVLEPETATDRIRLRWRPVDTDTVFSAHQMSDGTLRFICLATLLNQPELPHLIALDEPELGLHPFAIAQLADMLQAVARSGSQVVLATQSVTLMDQFALDDLIVVESRDGGSMFSRPDQETLQGWLDEYSLGELWLKNLLGGRPRPPGRG